MIPITGCLGTLAYNKYEIIERETLTAICMIFLAIVILIYPITSPSIATILLIATGFFLYGPHVFLVSTVPGRFSQNKIAASSTGLIDGMGYIGAMLTGIIVPFLIAEEWFWVFLLFAICSLLVAMLTLTTRRYKVGKKNCV